MCIFVCVLLAFIVSAACAARRHEHRRHLEDYLRLAVGPWEPPLLKRKAGDAREVR